LCMTYLLKSNITFLLWKKVWKRLWWRRNRRNLNINEPSWCSMIDELPMPNLGWTLKRLRMILMLPIWVGKSPLIKLFV
jgi:hypothetical protein